MFRVQIDALDIFRKGQVLRSLMLPFLLTASSGDANHYHHLGLCQLIDAASFVLTPLNIRTHVRHLQQDCQEQNHNVV